MLRFTFFRTRKPKTFEFTPRYYDPIKESLERRRRMIRMDLGKDVDHPERGDISFRNSRHGYKGDDYYHQMSRKATMRMLAAFAAAILAAWLLLDRLDILNALIGK
jgi:hypothetical protein